MQKLKRDDEVIVIAGRDKGKRGKITRVLKDGRLIVSGINMIKRHTRPNPNIGQQGGIVEKEASIHISNLTLLTSKGEATRVGIRMDGDKKVRFSKKSNEVI